MEQQTKVKASFEAVSAAAEALLESGVQPSVRLVIERLGGGSPNSVTAHLRKWRDERPRIESRRSIVIDERIHTLIAEQIEKAAGEARAAADQERASAVADMELVATAGRALEEEVEQLRARVIELDQRTQHDAGVIETLRSDLEAEKSAADAAIAQAHAEASATVKKANDEAAIERQRADNLNRDLGAAQARLEAVPRIEDALARTTADLDKERERRTAAESKIAALGANVEMLTATVNETKVAAAAAQKAAQDAQIEAATERTRATSLQSQVAQLVQLAEEKRPKQPD
jgi:colicin import membrane protein